MIASIALAPLVAACATLGVARATFYRAQTVICRSRKPSPWALSDAEQANILAVLHEPAYVDQRL